MNHPYLTQIPMTKTGMLIRKPVAEVFEAIVDPALTTQFWFTKSSGRLEAGQQVVWEWEMYNVSIPVTIKRIEPHRRIVIEWPGYKNPTTVEWTLSAQADGTTFVEVTEVGFTGNGDELVQQVTDSTQGFSLMLAGLKALLEYNIRLNLVADRYPAGLPNTPRGHRQKWYEFSQFHSLEIAPLCNGLSMRKEYMIRVKLPHHLRTLAGLHSEVQVEVQGVVTQRSVLDAVEARYPVLIGTMRDRNTQQRRSMLRVFACSEDLSHQSPDAPLPAAVANGTEPLLIVGAMAGG